MPCIIDTVQAITTPGNTLLRSRRPLCPKRLSKTARGVARSAPNLRLSRAISWLRSGMKCLLRNASLIHHESISVKMTNHHVDAVSTLHRSALVREGHPVGLTCFRRAALAQLADLFKRRNYQLDPRFRIDQDRLRPLVV